MGLKGKWKEIDINGVVYMVRGDYPNGKYEKIPKSCFGKNKPLYVTTQDIINKIDALEKKVDELLKK